MKVKILICVPTCNRPEMVEEVLKYELEYYFRLGLDVCYYDSSSNSSTEMIISMYVKKGYRNLFYKRMPNGKCVDFKIADIFRNDVFLLNYDYIWLISDSISIYEDALKEILPILRLKYHLVRLPLMGSGNKIDYVSNNQNDWFQNCSAGMAHMASTIMSTELLKVPINWKRMSEKFIGSNEIKNSKHEFFFTVAFYLEAILKLPEFRGIYIGNRIKWMRESPYKQDISYWNALLFRVWVKSYSNTILKLPDQYSNKKKVIKNSDNILAGRFEKKAMIGYRIHNKYSVKDYIYFYKYWRLVSSVSLMELFLISIIPKYILKRKYGKNYGIKTLWLENLKEIEKRIGREEIIVYGAGFYGERVLKQLMDDGYGNQIAFVAVTNTMENVCSLIETDVKSIFELKGFCNKAVVIVATLPDTAEKISLILKELNFEKIETLF